MKGYVKIFIILLSLSLVFFAGSGVYAEGILEATTPVEAGPNVDPTQAKSDAYTYYFDIGPGGSYYNVSDLYADAPEYYDTYVMTVTDITQVELIVEDCCIMGDTICAQGGGRRKCATSPNVVTHTATLNPGTYTFRVGYARCPGGYPAGYYTYVNGY